MFNTPAFGTFGRMKTVEEFLEKEKLPDNSLTMIDDVLCRLEDGVWLPVPEDEQNSPAI